jgi:multiple antibiotic resistance protein
MGLQGFFADTARELLLVPVTLLPIINPLSTASVFVATVGRRRDLAKQLARQVCVNSFFVIVVGVLVGGYVLRLFGISLPVVRIAGGLLVAANGWRMLNARREAVQVAVAEQAASMPDDIMQRSFVPLTFPLTTGPGTLAACIALGTQMESSTPLDFASGAIVAVGGAGLVALVVYLILRNSPKVVARLGDTGELVLQQVMAFILMCIGIQLMWNGWEELH